MATTLYNSQQQQRLSRSSSPLYWLLPPVPNYSLTVYKDFQHALSSWRIHIVVLASRYQALVLWLLYTLLSYIQGFLCWFEQ